MNYCSADSLAELERRVNDMCERYDVIDFQVFREFRSSTYGEYLYTNGYNAILKVRL